MKTGVGCFLGLAAFLATSFIVQLPDEARAQDVAAQGAHKHRKPKEACGRAPIAQQITVPIEKKDTLQPVEIPVFGTVQGSGGTSTSSGDIPISSCPQDPIKIIFHLQGLDHTLWKTSKDLDGKSTANESIWMVRYPDGSDGKGHDHPGARDWPECAAKMITPDSSTDIHFDFTGCSSQSYDYEYSLHLKQCVDPGAANPTCVDLNMDPQIIFRPYGLNR